MKKQFVTLSVLCTGILFAQKTDSIPQTVEKQIEAVELVAKKKLVERKVDRLVFNVGESVSTQGGDALDALRVTPGVIVQNESISMVGKNGASIMVNDKLLRLSGDELANFLKTIKSEDIQKIEVITAPPAKYDAEGDSGIINIQLKKAKRNSWGGNITNSYTQATHLLGNWGGALNFQKDKWTITSNLNYTNGSYAPYQEYTLFYPNFIWSETNKRRVFQNSVSGKVGIDYQVSPKTTMGVEYAASDAEVLAKGEFRPTITLPNGEMDYYIITPNRVERDIQSDAVNLYSFTKINDKGEQLSINANYFKYQSGGNNKFSTQKYLPDGMPFGGSYQSADNISGQRVHIYSASADYELPLEWAQFSLGGKVSFIDNGSNVAYFDTSAQNPIMDPTRSNVFDYKENTQALYISGNKNWSEKWKMKLGLRLETTQTKGYSETLQKTHKNNYTQLFPTLYLTYDATENRQYGMNYSRRIHRPSYSDLNPFRLYSSQFNYSEGNPFLQPYFIDNFEINWSYKNYFASVDVSLIKNGSDQVTFVSPDDTVQRVIPFNFYKQFALGTVHHYTLKPWKWWESSNMLNVKYVKTTPQLENTSLPILDKITAYFSSNNSFVLNDAKTLRAELGFYYHAPSVAGSYTTTVWYYVDAGIRYSMFDKKLNVSLNGMDIFRTNKVTFTQTVNGIKQENFDYRDSQKIRLSVTYSFGKSFDTKKVNQSNEEEKERL
ncbi:outer membrane beta-barrel family protein [Bergeyella zoohelcum]|uniref:Outer membrane protein beta-barrel domain-containing protein n=1 Tax=Bergeyella zoohelcum ATCC 43767 TaxID=883096 RepID=K1LL34_9FLAO|nr:outer membrane beta-barrel family protein [Bergeyella zoohelcum]EKB57485.1 hypothetical protein HMPREF9699_00971 [Bergeyella zoohelcum ATCC 43767]SUV48845.1 Outer membrane receptor for Fe3+-dicitrate [Bergeyella zoohelcum]